MDKMDNFQKSRKTVLFKVNIKIFGCGQKYTVVYIIICIKSCRKNKFCTKLPLNLLKARFRFFKTRKAERALPFLPLNMTRLKKPVLQLFADYIGIHIRN